MTYTGTDRLTQRITFMSRQDNFGTSTFDSISWLYEAVIDEVDLGLYNSAVVYGNEDFPDKIEFFVTAEPKVGQRADRTWVSR